MDLGKIFGDFDSNQLGEVIDLVANNRGALERLGQLPEYLDRLADGLAGAGEQARSASAALVGDPSGDGGLQGTLAQAAEALSQVVASVGAGAERVAEAAESAAKVPLMDGPASRLAGAAEEMSTTTARLGDLAEAMSGIGDLLAKVGDSLGKLGDYLDSSGNEARGFAQLD